MNQKTLSKREITLRHILLVMICLASLNFMNAYYYFIYIAIGVFCIIPNAHIRMDYFPFLSLFVLGVSWVLFSPSTTISVFGAIKPFTYMLCYTLGASMISADNEINRKENPYKFFYITVIAAAAGTLIHYILNWTANIDATVRNTIDFWTGKTLAATGQAALACIPLALAISCLFSRNGKKIKIVSAIAILLVMAYNLVLAGRTLIIMTIATSAIAFLYQFLKQKGGKMRVILITALVIIALIIIYLNDWFGVKSFVEDSAIYNRFFSENSTIDIDEDGRLKKKIYHLQNMDRYIFGGAHIRDEIGHSHDIFLDTHDEAGIFAFAAIVAYMIHSLVHFLKCIRNKSLPFMFRQIVLCLYVIIYLEFMIEPILQGMPWLFALFCLIDGYVGRLLLESKRSARSEI